jgi:hypothetical protein
MQDLNSYVHRRFEIGQGWSMSRKRACVVVPLAPAHDQHLPGLIEQLAHESSSIERILICRSSDNLKSHSLLWELIDFLGNHHQLRIELMLTRPHQSAGRNRNAGWKAADAEFTAFVDADDIYASGRLNSMLNVATEYKSDLVVHDFLVPNESLFVFPEDKWEFEDLIHSEALSLATFPYGRDRTCEGSSPGDTNIQIPPNHKNRQGVHHGHMMVRTDLRNSYQFGDLYPGEDGQLCRDILWGRGRVVFIPARLSAYLPLRSAGNPEILSRPVDECL